MYTDLLFSIRLHARIKIIYNWILVQAGTTTLSQPFLSITCHYNSFIYYALEMCRENYQSIKINVFLLLQNDIFSKIRHIFSCIFKFSSPSFQGSPASGSSSDLHKCNSHFHMISPMKHIHFKIMLLSMTMPLKGLFPCECFNNHIPHFLTFPMLCNCSIN